MADDGLRRGVSCTTRFGLQEYCSGEESRPMADPAMRGRTGSLKRHEGDGDMVVLRVLLFVLLLIPCRVEAFEQYNKVKKFDIYFKKYSKRFFGPGFDWRYFKAQSIAESGLKPEAESRVGAVGLMQIMPRTYDEIVQKHPYIKGSRDDPRWNVAAGIFYDRLLWKAWKAERAFTDRLNFMFGSFNAGRANIVRAQKIAERVGLDPVHWESIEATLPKITGKRSRETINYINKIHEVKEVLR
ncbi:MAG: transglycosylase SLT domain-containing protein [Deltaproteobacteria bacterium]|nr:MAG: transglycosylase SLT domain-containing protein [Deltaproteobacteria bacterium]